MFEDVLQLVGIFAKLLLVYISALKIAAVLLLPSMLTVSVTYSAFGNPMFYGFFPLILLIIAAAPLLPLFIVVLFSLPVMWIGSRLKGRATVKTVFSLLFYIVLMAAYMVLVFFINTEGFGQNGNIVVACSRDAMNNEISTMKQKSADILGSIDYHRGVIDACDKMLNTLNPEFAAKQQQEQEIAGLKSQMTEMKREFTEFMTVLKEQLGIGSETAKNK